MLSHFASTRSSSSGSPVCALVTWQTLRACKLAECCLGTMSWGEQNTEAEAHEQLDYAWDQGINFLDAAEMYPVPPSAETQGRTEQYIGNWLKGRKREDVVIASKLRPHSSVSHRIHVFACRLRMSEQCDNAPQTCSHLGQVLVRPSTRMQATLEVNVPLFACRSRGIATRLAGCVRQGHRSL